MKRIFALLGAISSLVLASTSVSASTINADELATAGVQLVKLNAVSPEYPKVALSNKNDAIVDLQYDIDKNGMPVNIEVLDYQGSPHFVRAAVNALKDTRFQPVVTNEQLTSVVGLKRQYTFSAPSIAAEKVYPGLIVFNL